MNVLRLVRKRLFEKITLTKWKFDVYGVFFLFVGFTIATYLATVNFLIPRLFAAGDTDYVWDLSDSGEYLLSDNDLIEVVGGQARLKVRNYQSDDNTRLLYHLDETSGTDVTDSSANENSGTATGAFWTTGNLNNGFSLNGIDRLISVPDDNSLSLSQAHTLESWVKFDETFSNTSHSQRQTIIDKGDYRLYYDQETGRINYELVANGSLDWDQVAGNEINGSWDLNGKRSVSSIDGDGTYVYVGTGDVAAGDAEVWRWEVSSSSWTKIGGDGLNSSWSAGTYEEVISMTVMTGNLYVGLGTTAGDGEVWRWNGTSWTKIAGNSINDGWAGTIERVLSLTNDGTNVYAGLGITTSTDAQVWSWDGDAWTKIGGNATNSSWNTGPEGVYSLVSDADYVYAGLGSNGSDGQVWRFNKTTQLWTQIGGNGAASTGWASTGIEIVPALAMSGSVLYVGIGSTGNDGQVWRWNGSWTQLGGSNIGGTWSTGFESVRSLHVSGGNLYVGLGDNNSDARMWVYDIAGGTWSQLGGNGSGVTGSWTTHHQMRDIYVDGGVVYAGLYISNSNGQLYRYQDASWGLIGGAHINKSWGFYGLEVVENLTTSGGYLYAGTGNNVAGDALVWQFDGVNWTIVGGQGINGSWNHTTFEVVTSMASFDGDLYVGLGATAGDGDVWKYDGEDWEQIGGDNLNSGWNTGVERVLSLVSDSNYLYAGLGVTVNADSMVWRWDGSVWSQIGGRPPGSTVAINGSWTVNIEGIYSMLATEEYLYAGLGTSAGDADVYRWNGTDWTQIGGDGVNSSWAASTYETVETISMYRGSVYVGLGTTAGDAEVWRWNGVDEWTMVGGDAVNGSWDDATYTRVRSLAAYNGQLYATIGGAAAGSGEVWRYDLDTNTWTKVGGNSVNDSWANAIEDVYSLATFRGKLYAGTGNTTNVDAAVWSFGNSAFLQSTSLGQDTNWHHIAATYNGTTMKIFIDGVEDASVTAALLINDSSQPLLIGSNHGSNKTGESQGYFKGTLDEIRISNIARPSFNATPFTAIAQTIRPQSAVMTSQIKNWETFLVTEEADGGSISYRVSTDGGDTWNYWNGASWVVSSNTSQVNTQSVVSDNISSLVAGSDGIMWQAVLTGSGNQQVAFSEVEIEATSDVTAPTNPDTLTSLSASGGEAIITDTWHVHPAPYFSWSGATDTGGSGVGGYYVYFGTDETAEPTTAGAFQESANYTPSSLISGETYYLRIKSRDAAGNAALSTWEAFIYKIDNTGPTNPSTITVSPSGYASTNSFTFSWPVGVDTGSGIAGYQYKTNAESGDLSDWSSTITARSILIPDAAHQTGENTFLLRTIDVAGNVSVASTQVLFYYGGEGPSVPNFLSVTPQTNTNNSFSFSWDEPDTYSGDASGITYCYTVNTLPTEASCTFTSAGATSLSASSFATQVGLNTFYLVAKNPVDAGGTINYANYTSVTFTANTSAPGIPLNADIADISIKSTSNWRLTISWSAPSDAGSGVANYEIFRSEDDSTYEEIASTTGLAYVDIGLNQRIYYYKVRACDSVNNCGAFTTAVSAIPTGKFISPAELISGPEATGITTKNAIISWSTDRVSDSRVQYGLSPGTYFESEPSMSTQVTSHVVSLTNLDPGTAYYYRTKWTDEDGNIGISEEKTFTTEPAPVVSGVKVRTASLNTASIDFTVSGASSVKIYYGKTSAFGGVLDIQTSTAESNYTAVLEDLEDGVKYFYRMNAVDSEDAEYEGTILDFETLPRPRISTIRLQEVKGTAQPTVLVTWNTNTAVSSIVTFYPEDDRSLVRDEINVALKSGSHKMVLRGLIPNTNYSMVVRGRDIAGNEAISDTQRFTTATDTRPPSIIDLKVEGVILKTTGGEQTAQLVVSWNTDEPATSQVEFGEGTGTTYSQRTQEDSNRAYNHVVVISNLVPSRVYHLRAVSIDEGGNIGASVDTVTITPKATDNALDLVISNLREVFNFLQ